MTVRIFLHGLESSNQGTKSIFFRERYPNMITPHFTGDLYERMDTLNSILSDKSGIRLVGSSFGGLMASLFALENESRVERMILLAPAIHMMGLTPSRNKTVSVPVWVYHGSADQVIPLAGVESIAREIFPNLSFHSVDDDHFLHRTFKIIDWDSLLA
ncbi:MAG: alpha/beta fold hydrolase [Thermodesulfobacteriota bacterium]|nr:alpha/beta fold hydrolase [Thermodesulfobacteriota bacterium]